MNNDQGNPKHREALLQTAAALIAARDELLKCAEMLRECQFNSDPALRRAATASADALIGRARGDDRSDTP
jgi:hypothetical protein